MGIHSVLGINIKGNADLAFTDGHYIRITQTINKYPEVISVKNNIKEVTRNTEQKKGVIFF